MILDHRIREVVGAEAVREGNIIIIAIIVDLGVGVGVREGNIGVGVGVGVRVGIGRVRAMSTSLLERLILPMRGGEYFLIVEWKELLMR